MDYSEWVAEAEPPDHKCCMCRIPTFSGNCMWPCNEHGPDPVLSLAKELEGD
jgi:hypothetical protein